MQTPRIKCKCGGWQQEMVIVHQFGCQGGCSGADVSLEGCKCGSGNAGAIGGANFDALCVPFL
jgi:hypothetical protein